MGTFHEQGGSLYTPAIEMKGPGAVDVDVVFSPPLTGQVHIEVQESADEVEWVAHPVGCNANVAESPLM